MTVFTMGEWPSARLDCPFRSCVSDTSARPCRVPYTANSAHNHSENYLLLLQVLRLQEGYPRVRWGVALHRDQPQWCRVLAATRNAGLQRLLLRGVLRASVCRELKRGNLPGSQVCNLGWSVTRRFQAGFTKGKRSDAQCALIAVSGIDEHVCRSAESSARWSIQQSVPLSESCRDFLLQGLVTASRSLGQPVSNISPVQLHRNPCHTIDHNV